MDRLTIKAPSGLIHLEDNKEYTVNLAIKKLSDYEDLEEQGLLLKLPCNIGSIVYVIREDLLSATIKSIEFEGHIYSRKIPNYFIKQDIFKLSMIDKIGETVFLTKEEAEAKLKELQEDAVRNE